MGILNWIGSFFVYRSPKPYQGFARFLETRTARGSKSMIVLIKKETQEFF